MTDMLKDFRGKITTETWCAIEAEHRSSGREHAEIVRDVLHGWASRKIAEATVLGKLMESEGIAVKARERR